LSLASIDLQGVIETLLGLCKTNEAIENLTNKVIVCPHCSDAPLVGNGKSKKEVSISQITSFSWRYKLLTSFSQILDQEFSRIEASWRICSSSKLE